LYSFASIHFIIHLQRYAAAIYSLIFVFVRLQPDVLAAPMTASTEMLHPDATFFHNLHFIPCCWFHGLCIHVNDVGVIPALLLPAICVENIYVNYCFCLILFVYVHGYSPLFIKHSSLCKEDAMKLTNIAVKNAKPQEKAYYLPDGDNLSLMVMPRGEKIWRLGYRHNNKRKQIALGKYPVLSLAEAREIKLEKQKLLVRGIDPVQERRQQRLDDELKYENHFEAVAREWHSQRIHTWDPKHANNILNRLATHLFPKLGKKPITEIKPQELLHVLRPIEAEGKNHIAGRMLQTCSQIFRYAVACGKAERDITQDLRGALTPVQSKNHRHLKENDLPEFLTTLSNYDLNKLYGGCNGNPIVKWGFQLLILTFVRTGELRGARWDEIDWEKSLWRIPAERMKMKDSHVVPLSHQSLVLLKKLHEVTGHSYSGFIFPSIANPRKTISENTFLKAIHLMGYKELATGHGFRSTASTILNEHGYRADVIERQLAHCERNQVRAVYNHAQYLPERKDMMQWWGDYLVSKGMVV
jgi:integrase